MSKLLSSCCQVTAKVNVRDGGYFCSKCGKDCGASEKKSGLTTKSTLKAERKSSGERELFVMLWAKCNGKSEASGKKLLPPEHSMFHHQGSHLLPKGAFPDYKLDPRNVVMITPDEHEMWHHKPQEFRKKHPHIASRYDKLYLEAQRKNRPPQHEDQAY